jgi:hypothetical protein
MPEGFITSEPQKVTAIYIPFFALFVLTGVVAVKMFRDRVGVLRQQKLPLSTFSDAQKIRETTDSRAADHFRNLFEVPVFFYVVCLAMQFEHKVTMPFVILAWVFVFFRYLQAYVHCTTNRVSHRARAFIFGVFVLTAMWVYFAVALLP